MSLLVGSDRRFKNFKTRSISIRFFKIEILISDPNFYFTAYDTLVIHACGQSHGARWQVLFSIKSMSDQYTLQYTVQ